MLIFTTDKQKILEQICAREADFTIRIFKDQFLKNKNMENRVIIRKNDEF